MKNLTTLMRSMTVLLLFVMVGASTVLAQTAVDGKLHAERNGIGAVCEADDPCDLSTAIGAAQATDTVLVRVREDGAMTRLDDDIDFGATARIIGIYVDDDDTVTKGMIAIEGDVDIREVITVLKGTTLYLGACRTI